MRSFYLTLLPMLVLAALTMVAGERLARREVEERIPLDRERLLDLSAALSDELDRLDTIYLNHLNHLADGYFLSNGDENRKAAEDTIAVNEIHLFSSKKKVREMKSLNTSRTARVPDLTLEENRGPLNPRYAVTIPLRFLEDSTKDQSGWLESPAGDHTVYWRRMQEGELVAIIIDKHELNGVTSEYLKGWLASALTPLLESKSYFSIGSLSGGVIAASSHGGTKGAAAIVIPLRHLSGEWQIQAWDGISLHSYHDSLTMILSSLLAVVISLSGFVLHQQQKRSLKLATQRVSFVNQVSHELGAPLTNIALNLSLASDDLSESSPNARRRLDLIIQEVERLNRLVRNVLTFSQHDRGVLEVHLEPCYPDDIISNLLDSYRPALMRRGVDVEFDANVNAEIKIDPDALAQIVANLISNVEKYASSGKWLGVRSFLRGGRLVVVVMDRGLGIPEDARGRIFKSFERVESGVNEGSSGTGLGLSIARELARKLTGTLRLIPSDQGCHFELDVSGKLPDSVIEINQQEP